MRRERDDSKNGAEETTLDRRNWLGLLGAGATIGLLGGVGGTGTVAASNHGSTLGGGPGYSNTVPPSAADYTARNAGELGDALSSANGGQTVYVPGNETINVGSNSFTIKSDVTLASDRGINGSDGALIETDNEPKTLFDMQHGARLTGLRLQGPWSGGPNGGSSSARAVTVYGDDVEIDNCDIRAFSYAGIYIDGSGEAHVHHCIITENNKDGLGYGISMDSGHNRIEYNYLNYNRHSIASTGDHHGYTVRYNHFGREAAGIVIDIHGADGNGTTAGVRSEVNNNVVEAVDDMTGDHDPLQAIQVRGVPEDVYSIQNNWFYNPKPPRDSPAGSWTTEAIIQPTETSWRNVEFSGNYYGRDANVTMSDIIPGYDGTPANGAGAGGGGGGGGSGGNGGGGGSRLQVIPTGGEAVDYTIVVDGDVSMVSSGSHNAGDADSLTNHDDGTTTIEGATGSTRSKGGDTYILGGEVLEFTANGPLDVTLDGESTSVSELDGGGESGGNNGGAGGRLQVIPTGGEAVEYTVVVDGDVSIVDSGPHNAGDSDTLSTNDDGTTTIDGATGSTTSKGGDTYDLGGEVLEFSANGSLEVTLDGESTSVSELDGGGQSEPDGTLLEISRAPSSSGRVDYIVQTDGTVKDGSDRGQGQVGGRDTVFGSTASGAVWTGTDPYILEDVSTIEVAVAGGAVLAEVDGETLDLSEPTSI